MPSDDEIRTHFRSRGRIQLPAAECVKPLNDSTKAGPDLSQLNELSEKLYQSIELLHLGEKERRRESGGLIEQLKSILNLMKLLKDLLQNLGLDGPLPPSSEK